LLLRPVLFGDICGFLCAGIAFSCHDCMSFVHHDSMHIAPCGCWVTLHTLHSSSCALHVVLYVLRASMCDLVCRWGNWYSRFHSKPGSKFREEGGRVAGDMCPSATCSLPQTCDSAHQTSTRDGLCVVPRLPTPRPMTRSVWLCFRLLHCPSKKTCRATWAHCLQTPSPCCCPIAAHRMCAMCVAPAMQ
jgi:hypothetical protein